MKPPSIGELRHVMRLEAPGDSPDGAGGMVAQWQLVEHVHAALRPIGGTERQLADGVEPRGNAEIWLRHRESVGAHMRFVLDARVFEIKAVIDPDERRQWLRCLVEERQA